MNATMDELWENVDFTLRLCKCIAWDGCHKIYLAMDETEQQFFVEQYPHVVHGDFNALRKTIREWWNASCSLRFVQAVSNNEENPNAGFVSLIEQFADQTDEDGWDSEDLDD